MRQYGEVNLYHLLSVEPDCSLDELRSAYRQRARELHPDLAENKNGGHAMARVNDAWRILSDPDSRTAYDATIVVDLARSEAHTPQPAPQAQRSRRQAWVLGVQMQISRLSHLAGRSATQTLLVRSNRAPRSAYEALVELIVASLSEDTEARVRAGRAAGAAPLDLGVAATLIGLRTLADRIRRQASLGITIELEMTAELVDRMWDVLGHELSKPLTDALGGNPNVAQALRSKR
jgi:curved DNA-binding protein CbpA